MEVIFKRDLKNYLTTRVKGDVKIFTDNDTMFIDIIDEYGKTFRYSQPNFNFLIYCGLTAKELANIVTKDYLRCVLMTYFKKQL